MRDIFLLMNVSLDGYFEAPGGDISGFVNDNEAFSRSSGRTVDTLLFGRRTYDMMKSFWPTPQAEAMQPDIARFMNQTPKVVASHSDFDPGWHNVTVISGDVVGEVARLKAGPGATIGIFGSNTLCISLMQAGLIDEFQILVNPVAFGAGTPLFAGLPQPMPFALAEAHPFKSGVVMLTYKRAN